MTDMSGSGLGIFPSMPNGQPTPVTSTFPPNMFAMYGTPEHYTTCDGSGMIQYHSPSLPELRHPQPKRPYAPIAPQPSQVLPTQKRKRVPDNRADSSTSEPKRSRTTSATDLAEDNAFLLKLRVEEGLTWNEITERFKTERNQPMTKAALQMRLSRMSSREKKKWTDEDSAALKQAHLDWETNKWEIISAKVSLLALCL